MANDAVRGFQGRSRGRGRGRAGFLSRGPVSRRTTSTAAATGSIPRPQGRRRRRRVGTVVRDPAVVDVEARAVPFDEWFSSGSTDASDRGFPTAAAARGPVLLPASSSPPPPPPPPPPRGAAPRTGTRRRGGPRAPTRPERVRRGDDRADAGRREWGYGAFGRDAGAPPYGSDRGGAGRNRWREFMTGRFYGEFQEDLIAARFDVGGGVAVEEEEEEEEKRGATGRGANFDDDDDPGAGAVR